MPSSSPTPSSSEAPHPGTSTPSRPKMVSRAASAPPASPASSLTAAPTSAPAPVSTHLSTTGASTTTATSPTTFRTATTISPAEMDEDEVIAQATAFAIQAQQELAKISKAKQAKASLQPSAFALFSSVGVGGIGGIGGGGEGGVESKTKHKLPLGDVQQRKLIEKKLGHALDKEPSTVQLPLMHGHGHGHGHGGAKNNVTMMKDVKEKFENLFPQASSKSSSNASHGNSNNNSYSASSADNTSPSATHTLSSSSSNNGSNVNAGYGSGSVEVGQQQLQMNSPFTKRRSRSSSPLDQPKEEKVGSTTATAAASAAESVSASAIASDTATTHLPTRTISPPIPQLFSNNNASANANVSTSNSANTSANTVATTRVKPTLSAIVWKRRNGYGKFSMNAWEKRRMDLVGTKVMYYKQKDTDGTKDKDKDKGKDKEQQQQLNGNNGDNEGNTSTNSTGAGDLTNSLQTSSVTASTSVDESKPIEMQQQQHSSPPQTHSIDQPSNFTSDILSNNSNDVSSLIAPLSTNINTNSTTANANNTTTKSQPSTKKDIHQFWEQTKQNFNKTINELSAININTYNINNSGNSSSGNNGEDDPDSPHSPRGCIDLHKEVVTVSALSDHEKSLTSVSPTPYGLCIATKGEDKWKICFESHGEQIKWLTVLTEIIVKKSVDTYNQELVKSRRVMPASVATNAADSSNNDSIVGFGGGSGNNSSSSPSGIGSDGGASNSTGGIVNALNSANSGIKLDIFRPSPERKDGMWNMDEKFSSRNLLIINEDGESEDDISSSSPEKENLFENKLDSVSSTAMEEIIPSNQSKCIETPIISDLPPPVEALIRRGADSGPEWMLTGHNLSFVIGVTNLSILWIYFTPVHWLLFPFFLATINILIILPLMEKAEQDCQNEGDQEDRKKTLTRIRTSVQILRRSMRSMGSFRQNELPKPATPIPVKKKEPKTIDAKIKPTGQSTTATVTAKKPIAGTTTKKLLDSTESHFVNGHEFMAWSTHPSEDVQVRSHGYSKTKKKVPSPSSMYEVMNVEIFDSSMRIPEIASKVVLPKVTFDDGNEVVRWKSPDIFVVSLAVPTEEPSFTRSTEDGYGFNVTIYYKMKKETREILKRITAPGYNCAADSSENHLDVQKRLTNSVRLWEEWCQKAPTDAEWQAKFKLIANVLNPNEVGLPSWIGKYCGKPVLIKRKGKTGFLSTHPEINAFEFDISLHPFPYLAKKAMAYLKATMFKKAIASFSYVIEARSDDELPEVLIGDAVKVYYPNPDIVIDANDFFAGTAPKSIKQD